MNTTVKQSISGIHVLPEGAALPIQPRQSLIELCPVICGGIGHGVAGRMTVIGHVNFASRIESAAKQLGHPLLVSPRVRELVDDDQEWRVAGIAKLQGIADPMPLHSPVSDIS